jgi:hypothetical protein
MKSFVIFILVLVSFKSLSLGIDNVTLSFLNGNPHLRIQGGGLDLKLDKVDVLYSPIIESNHIIHLSFEGCGDSNLWRNFDTTVQINSTIPFDVCVYSIWDSSIVCGFPTEPIYADSVFMSYSELLATTSLTSLSQEFGQIYPNPTQGMITVDFEVESVLIYDVNYSLVDKFEIKTKSFDLSHLESGFYFLEFIQNNKKRVYRILKE